MSEKRRNVHLQEGYQPKLTDEQKKRLPLRADGTLDPLKLKPPKGDTAIQPPVSLPLSAPPKTPNDGKAS